MKKKLLPLAIAAAMAPGFASAADVSGFADIFYTITDDSGASGSGSTATNSNEGKFSADAEVDFSASPADGVTVRVDVDLKLGLTSPDSTGATDTDTVGASIEQAFFAWAAAEGVTVIGGVFNNPIGYEAEDAPDMDFSSHGAVYTALDSQTALNGDNIAGLAVAGAVGPVTITAALVNDLNQVNEENTFALVANFAPMEGLDMELGLATQTGNALLGDNTISAASTSVGNVTNFNIVFTGVENLTVGLDYLTGSEVLDSAYDLWAGYSFGALTAKLRMSKIDYNADDVTKAIAAADAATVTGALTAVGLPTDDLETTSIYLSYQVASNLSAALEISSMDLGSTTTTSSDLTTLELIATF